MAVNNSIRQLFNEINGQNPITQEAFMLYLASQDVIVGENYRQKGKDGRLGKVECQRNKILDINRYVTIKTFGQGNVIRKDDIDDINKTVFQFVDTNKDGLLTWDEFQNILPAQVSAAQNTNPDNELVTVSGTECHASSRDNDSCKTITYQIPKKDALLIRDCDADGKHCQNIYVSKGDSRVPQREPGGRNN